MRTLILTTLTIFITVSTYCQKIVIDELPFSEQTKYLKGTDSIDFTKNFFIENDLTIEILKTLNPKTLSFKTDNGLQQLTPDKKQLLETFVNYTLPKDPKFNEDEKDLKLTNDKGSFDITLKVSNSKPEVVNNDAQQKCKDSLKKLLSYKFIKIDVSSIANICDPSGCYPCSDSGNIVYDFATNRINKHVVKVGDPLTFHIKNANPSLYDVTISDTAVNYNQELTELLGLLSGGDFLKKISSGTEEIKAQNAGCVLTLSDSVTVAVTELAEELSFLQVQLQELSPYYDASCYSELLKKIKAEINTSITSQFGKEYGNIFTFNDMVSFVKANEKSDTGTDKPQTSISTSLNDAYQKLFTPHFAYLYKIPEVKNVDEVDFQFNILPKNKDAALPVVKGGIIKVYTKGGFKVDVSSGLYYAWMNNQQFSVRADSTVGTSSTGVDSTTNRFSTLNKENTGKGEFGFSSFLHFYPRTGTSINVSGVIGAGVSFQDKPQPRYFAGLGFLFGRNDRIALNAGAIFGNVNELSTQYAKDENGNFKNLSYSEAGKDPAYIKHFQIKPFISLTYNLSFVKKKSETQTSTPPDNSAGGKATPAKDANNSSTDSGDTKEDNASKPDDKESDKPKAASTTNSSGSTDSILKSANKIKIKKRS